MEAFVVRKRPQVAPEKVSQQPPAKKAKRAKAGKVAGKTIEQWRRALGNDVKTQIKVEKWAIEARTHCVCQAVALEVFEELIVPNAASVIPAEFDSSTPVVVASIASTSAMAEIFGATKIKGGTRMGSWSADKGELVFVPKDKELRIWWTMK